MFSDPAHFHASVPAAGCCLQRFIHGSAAIHLLKASPWEWSCGALGEVSDLTLRKLVWEEVATLFPLPVLSCQVMDPACFLT